MPIKITVTKNGPYQVNGDLAEVELHDTNGTPYDVAHQKRIFLCRCGASTPTTPAIRSGSQESFGSGRIIETRRR